MSLVDTGSVRFAAWEGEPSGKIPSTIRFEASAPPLRRRDYADLERSLFQKKLLWWFRNSPRQDYGVQGWRKRKIYPDFIFTESDLKDGASRLYVLETKGAHLKNEDTAYKQEVFDFCNKLADRAAPTWRSEFGVLIKKKG